MSRRLTGILGGTFDPVHIGHLQLARDAIQALDLDALRCIPAGQPPHRPAPVTSATDRLAMVKLAFADQARCMLDDAEIRQSEPSWTIRTLERLRDELPDDSLVLIVGADAFLGLSTWHRWTELLDFAHIAVANRPGSNLAPSAMPPALAALWQDRYTTDVTMLRQSRNGRIVSFTIVPCSVSATRIRQAVSQGEPISDLVTPAVENYIRQHHLYKNAVC